MGLDSVISMAYLKANSMVYHLHNSTIFYIYNLAQIIFSEFERWDSMDKANNMRWTTVWMPPFFFFGWPTVGSFFIMMVASISSPQGRS